jgi:hypothetical protein
MKPTGRFFMFGGSYFADLKEFLESDKETTEITGFRGITQARQFAREYASDGSDGCGYSATMEAAGIGKRAYVKVTKNMLVHQTRAALRARQTNELQGLKSSIEALRTKMAAAAATAATAQNTTPGRPLPAPRRNKTATPPTAKSSTSSSSSAAATPAPSLADLIFCLNCAAQQPAGTKECQQCHSPFPDATHPEVLQKIIADHLKIIAPPNSPASSSASTSLSSLASPTALLSSLASQSNAEVIELSSDSDEPSSKRTRNR